MTEQTNNDEFTFFCPECNSMKKMRKSDIGKVVDCEECCETVTIDYPETRPCPKCKKSIKLKAKVCKYCKQRVMPFVDPFARETVAEDAPVSASRKSKIDPRIKPVALSLTGLLGGFAVGFYGTHAVARITRHCISGKADYLVGAILGIYLAVHFYRSKR